MQGMLHSGFSCRNTLQSVFKSLSVIPVARGSIARFAFTHMGQCCNAGDRVALIQSFVSSHFSFVIIADLKHGMKKIFEFRENFINWLSVFIFLFFLPRFAKKAYPSMVDENQ